MFLMRPFGVYRPQADTWLLAEALDVAGIGPGADVLEVCSGTGALSIAAARTRPRSQTAVDLSRRAAIATWINTALRGIRVQVHHGDAVEVVRGRRFDLVLANPPYVPGTSELPTRGPSRAWDAGPDGRAVLDRLCDAAPDLLAPGGTLLVVHSGLADPGESLRRLRAGGLKAAIVARATEPFGPVMRSRAAALRDLGLIGAGQEHEELVVVRADHVRPTGPNGQARGGVPRPRTEVGNSRWDGARDEFGDRLDRAVEQAPAPSGRGIRTAGGAAAPRTDPLDAPAGAAGGDGL